MVVFSYFTEKEKMQHKNIFDSIGR